MSRPTLRQFGSALANGTQYAANLIFADDAPQAFGPDETPPKSEKPFLLRPEFMVEDAGTVAEPSPPEDVIFTSVRHKVPPADHLDELDPAEGQILLEYACDADPDTGYPILPLVEIVEGHTLTIDGAPVARLTQHAPDIPVVVTVIAA